MKKYVLGLDISKKSTGVCLLRLDDGLPCVEEIFSIKPRYANKYTKMFFLAKNIIIREFENWFLQRELQKENVSVAFEYPVFSSYSASSELQFYLNQELLSLFDAWNIDCVGYPASTLKSFIRQCTYNSEGLHKFEGRTKMDKGKIRQVYERYFYPCNEKWAPNPGEIKDDDQMDSMFLALVGSFMQTPYLTQYRTPEMTKELKGKMLWEMMALYGDRLLMQDPNALWTQIRFTETFRWEPQILFNPNGYLSYKVQFKNLLKGLLDRHHQLKLTSKFFYPFSMLHSMTWLFKLAKVWHEEEEVCKHFAPKLNTIYYHLRKLTQGNFKFSLNKKGEFFVAEV
jgi:hypothetical protein